MVDESTLNLKRLLCYCTRRALATLNNVSWQFFRSFTIVWHQTWPEVESLHAQTSRSPLSPPFRQVDCLIHVLYLF